MGFPYGGLTRGVSRSRALASVVAPGSGRRGERYLQGMDERRFNDDEVAAIFAKATDVKTTTRQRNLQPSDGLTLAELQEIGREVGIAPDRVAQAAASIDRVGTATSRRFLVLPLGVGRTVELDRRLSDE